MHTKHTSIAASRRHTVGEKYAGFYTIDGSHPLKQAVPDAYIEYAARSRHGGKVFYFNFELARHMGLIPPDHPDKLNHDLNQAIIDTFSLEIINEYDLIHKVPVPEKDIRPNKYMATRYLQLQHPDKTGRTSGDGRGIWNGMFQGANGLWDISSCGTGATRLSPATVIEKKFFRTGDKNVSYGCGRADLVDGIYTTIMSEIFHHNHIPTERMLAIISFDDGSAINVRAHSNLLRPAHFFSMIKQEKYDALKDITDYFYQRKIKNQKWPTIRDEKQRYEFMLEKITEDFARTAAGFECDYIFCWMDWDGDNILTDSAIVDYGSIRQFGLFHHEYRFDDVERYSTTITEQKNKSKYIVQTFAQIFDFLKTGKKKRIERYRQHRALKLYDHIFEMEKDRIILHKTGFDDNTSALLLESSAARRVVRKYREIFRYFERIKARRGPHRVEDGISWDAVFCVRDILRELPDYFRNNNALMPDKQFLEIMQSKYASRRDMVINNNRSRRIREFQNTYLQLVNSAAKLAAMTSDSLLDDMSSRSAVINRADRITGDAVVYASEKLARLRRNIKPDEFHSLLDQFVHDQILKPDVLQHKRSSAARLPTEKSEKVINSIRKIVHQCREGI